jgi:platelet-activating factor acetylhydrolase IB subunit alpha
MVLTDRQREDLHAGIYEYLKSQPKFAAAAEAFAEADPASTKESSNNVGKTPLLEKKWTAIPRLQKKVLELERTVAQSAKIHAHRAGATAAGDNGGAGRRMLPRLPCTHTLQGHSAVVTCVKVHPVFTVVVSGSDDGTIKVRKNNNGIDDQRQHNGTTTTTTCEVIVSCY